MATEPHTGRLVRTVVEEVLRAKGPGGKLRLIHVQRDVYEGTGGGDDLQLVPGGRWYELVPVAKQAASGGLLIRKSPTEFERVTDAAKFVIVDKRKRKGKTGSKKG